MRSLLVLTTLAVAAAWVVVRHLPEGAAQAEPQIEHAQEIQAISLDGRNLPTTALRQLLVSRPGELLDSARLDHDRATLQTALEARGFLAAHVDAATVTFGSRGGAYVTFAIAQGPLFHIRNVSLVGAAEKDGVLTIASGDEASAERLERARQALVSSLPLKAGKQATVELKLHVDADGSAVDVTMIAR